MLRRTLPVIAFVAALLTAGCEVDAPRTPELMDKWADRGLYDLTVTSLAGETVDLDQYRGKVALVVNTASKCGFTKQYEGLQALSESLGDDVIVLGFPSNDFGSQEPGTAAEIQQFCSANYGVTFPMFQKVRTKAGDGQSEVYEFLGTTSGSLPGWNFGKYVVGRDGRTATFFGSRTKPDSRELRAAIDAALAKSPG